MPTSGASLGIFRIGFGIVQLWQTWEFFRPVLGQTTIDYLYTGSQVNWNFPYPGFEWVRPLPEPFTTLVFVLLGLSSLAVMLGLFTRPALFLNGVLFTYGWLLEAVWWNNHFYLTSLVAFLLFLSPCGRCFSIDRWREIRRTGEGRQWDGLIPFWSIFVLRAQLFIVYTYAAVVKMNPDWFMGEPIRMWFRKGLIAKPLAAVLPADIMGQVHSLMSSEIFIYSIVWGGFLFDLSIGILLCIRRTQLLALVLMFLFHGTNFWIFMIGAFPLMAIFSTLIFLDTDWPLRLWAWIRHPRWIPPDPGWMLLGMILVPIIGAVLGWRLSKSAPPPATISFQPVSNFGLLCIAMWIVLQSVIPLRHLTIEGDVHWTLEGSRFAWQVMARSHVSHVIYKIRDPAWGTQLAASGKVDWPTIDGMKPDWIYHDIDSTQVRPAEFPEIVIISEPWVRDRIFFNPGTSSMGHQEASETIRELWRRRYGRNPDAVVPTLPLREILLSFRQKLEQSAAGDPSIRARAILECNALVKHLDQIARDTKADPTSLERSLDLQNILNIFRDTTRMLGVEGQFMQELIKVRPWDIQTGRGNDWLQIVDHKLFAPAAPKDSNPGDAPRIQRSAWIGDPAIYLDLVRTQSNVMYFYPRIFFGYDREGQPVAFWNDVRDLVPLQQQYHASSGIMIHQYVCGRIAPFWKKETGVWPMVNVDSFSKLNQHPLQRLIDPQVDLASKPLKVWTHNEWILPQRYRQIIKHVQGHPQMHLIDTAEPREAIPRDEPSP